MPPSPVSHHLLLELFDCDPATMDRVEVVRDVLREAARLLKTEVIGDCYHRFTPQGVSGVMLIAESHLSIHTWPEDRYVAIDVFTCGEVHPREALDALRGAFRAGRWHARDVLRGLVDLPPQESSIRRDAMIDPRAVHRPMARTPSGPDPGNRTHLLEANGVVDVTGLVDASVTAAVRAEALQLLERSGERRDLRLATTGGTARHLTVVRSGAIAASPVLGALYADPGLRADLERIAGERLHDCPRADEQFLITRHHCRGDTHGWHWGDFSYALIWIVEAPPVTSGGLLQCVPHTRWDKQDPRILEHLVANPITTYHFGTGQVYLLRTDTTLHRTVPLIEDTVRVILNMTFAADRDLARSFRDDDRWWEDERAAAARAVADAR